MIDIRPMTIDDYDALVRLMKATPGVSFRDADSLEGTRRYLERNPGLSFVAESGPTLCAAAMCGHDGRRGYLQHVLVAPEHRQQGIAEELVARCLAGLSELGIRKCHLDVFKSNEPAARYWTHRGWKFRDDIDRYSFTRPGDEEA